MRFRHLTFLFALAAGLAPAYLPAQAVDLTAGAEISADEPLERDLETGIVTARGHAEVRADDIRITADLIQYFETDQRLEARGNVTATGRGIRVLAETLTYDVDSRTFTTGPFRAGYPPYFLEGESAEGAPEAFTGRNTTLYYGEPGIGTPRVRVSSVRVVPGERIQAQQIRLGVQGLGVEIPMATLDRGFSLPPIEASVAGGYRGNLGAFVQSELMLPSGGNWLAGGNFDLYTRRGLLVGPILAYRDTEGDNQLEATLNTGWIYDLDEGERATDRLNAPIDPQRAFATYTHRQTWKNLSLNARLHYQSDSEILRDFRWDLYPYVQEADSHVELLYTADWWFLTGLASTSFSPYFPITERLPEIRWDTRLLPVTEFKLYHRAHIHAAYLRRQTIRGYDDFNRLPEEELLSMDTGEGVGRLEAYYELQKPFDLTPWLRFTPQAASRYLTYSDSPSGETADRLLGQVGADLTAEASATWAYENETWDINGLRHITRPMLRYAYRTENGASIDELFQFDRYLATPTRPLLNLGDQNDIESLSELHLVRTGFENVLQTRSADGSTRDLARLDVFHDFNLDDADNALYTELSSQPARWLDVRLAHKWRTADGTAEAYAIDTSILSADKWRVTLSFDHLENEVSQVGLSGFYRLTENVGLVTSLRYDDELGDLTRQLYAIRQRWGSFWEFDYGLLLSQGDQRQEDVRVQLRVRFLAF